MSRRRVRAGRWQALSAALLLVGARPCGAESAAFPVAPTPALIASGEQIQDELGKPFQDPFEIRVKREGEWHTFILRSCRDFLGHEKEPWSAKDDSELRAARAAGVRCVALARVASAKEATQSFVRPIEWNRATRNVLPATLAVTESTEATERARRAGAKGKSWSAWDRSLRIRRETDDEATATGAGWRARLTVYAYGDFSGDGLDDVLLREDGAPARGTYSNSRLFVLTRDRGNGAFRVVDQW